MTTKVKNKKKSISNEDIRSVIKMLLDDDLLEIRTKNDPDSTSLLGTSALQGPLPGNPAFGGLFSAPGVRPDRFSALPRVRTLSNILRPMPSDIYNEIISIVTGATAGTGSNPADYCGVAPIPGNLKQCKQTFGYGRYFMKTQLNSVNDMGYLFNRADIPGRILNSAPEDNPLIPDIMWRIVDTRSQFQYAMFMQGVELERRLEPVLVFGDPAKDHTQTQLGFISEFKGLSLQIKTGTTDTSGVLCPAADSIVENWNGNLITANEGGGDTRTITTVIGDIWYAAQDRAKQVGMDDGLEFCFIMRKEMFRALTDIYANTYATSRFQASSLTAGSPVIQIATDANNLRLEMLRGQYLLVEGIPVPVVYSDGLPFAGQGNNVYQTDFFLVPHSWKGMPLLRLEYFNLGNKYSQEWNGWINPDRRRIINNGFYAMSYHSSGFCDEFLLASTMRLILETPFLAARVDNINFAYLAQTRNATPGTSLYVDGGTSYYSPNIIGG